MKNNSPEVSLARSLAEGGERMNLDISRRHERLLCVADADVYFLAAISHAFTWTGHAVPEDDFLQHAIEYLTTGEAEPLRRTTTFAGRFGPDRLTEGLTGWKTIVDNSEVQDASSCDARRLCAIQEQYLNVASELAGCKELAGVGPWLFCAPFKIVAAHRRELWETADLDDLLMPLGLEVVRGIRKVVKQQYRFCQGFEMSMLSDEEGGLMDGMGAAALVRGLSRKIAECGDTRVLHVNSGLYLYGRGEL